MQIPKKTTSLDLQTIKVHRRYRAKFRTFQICVYIICNSLLILTNLLLVINFHNLGDINFYYLINIMAD